MRLVWLGRRTGGSLWMCVCVWVACWVAASASRKRNGPTRKPGCLLSNHFPSAEPPSSLWHQHFQSQWWCATLALLTEMKSALDLPAHRIYISLFIRPSVHQHPFLPSPAHLPVYLYPSFRQILFCQVQSSGGCWLQQDLQQVLPVCSQLNASLRFQIWPFSRELTHYSS